MLGKFLTCELCWPNSLCDQALRVTLDSDLSSSIGFQLNNENIDNNDESSGTEPVVATFLADDFSEVRSCIIFVCSAIPYGCPAALENGEDSVVV